jgi:catechol 2,3-dioxygenase-like lactoylglutathione lyase family enzyme
LPNAINHVAISVTDIKLAIQWYRDVLGMSLLIEPVEISAIPSRQEDEHISNIVRKVFGPKLGRFLICHMSSSNGIGIELFQFLDPKGESRLNDSNFEFWKTGFFHIAITEPNIESLIGRISSSGGVMRTEVMELVPGTGKKICFCEDPFGNVIEIYSHSYEQFWANVRI